MAKYKLWPDVMLAGGVTNTETGASIPNNTSNKDWIEYLEWTTISGNVADSQYTEQEIEDLGWAEARADRDVLLTASDWSQLVDSPMSAEEVVNWATYRQDLRDVPQDYSTVSGIVWPEAPTYSGTG